MFASDNVSKKGFLTYPEYEGSDDIWVKRWFVIRRYVIARCFEASSAQPEHLSDSFLYRPYMFIYGNQSETDEQGVINLASVRVDYKKHLEDMLKARVFRNVLHLTLFADACAFSQKPNAFALYTNNNAYLFQAVSRADMIDWITKFDQFYPIQTLLEAPLEDD